jgi:hypothetical protein
MAKGVCLFFFRAGCRSCSNPPSKGRSSSSNMASFVSSGLDGEPPVGHLQGGGGPGLTWLPFVHSNTLNLSFSTEGVVLTF